MNDRTPSGEPGTKCCLQFPDAPYGQLRQATVDGAMAALGI